MSNPMLQWQLDEPGAELYERYLVPIFFAPGAGFLIDMVDLKQGERVLDVACGTGIVARHAAQRVGPGGKVTGLDLNESMLRTARRLSAGSNPAIDWHRGSATDLPFPERDFDVVFCQQGLQFFPDQQRAVCEMYRVLVPEGRLAVNVMRPARYNPAYAHLADCLDRHLGSGAGDVMRSPFSNLSTHDLRSLITNAGFRQVKITHGISPVRYLSVEEFVQQELASSPLSGSIASSGNGVQKAIARDLAEVLDDYVDDNGVTFPASAYFTVARR